MLLLDRDGLEVGLRAPASFRMNLVNASSHSRWQEMERLPGISNYFRGRDPRRWITNVPQYGGLALKGIYPGVDMVYYGRKQGIEYDFVVAVGADPDRIQLAFTGLQGLGTDASGDLILNTVLGKVRQKAPVAYQEVAGRRTPVGAKYKLGANSSVRIELSKYDSRRPLIIDPVLDFSTVLGGSGSDSINRVAVDTTGVYVAGQTSSSDFPVVNAEQPVLRGDYDAFVAKLNPSGSALLYSTFIGGSEPQAAQGLAVDNSGNAHITGYTQSTDFPLVNATQNTFGGGMYDAFATKLNASGNQLIYSTYLGGSNYDMGYGVAVDPNSGDAYIAGVTSSADFPTTAGTLQPSGSGGGFLVKLGPSGVKMFATYLNIANPAVAVDSSGRPVVAGLSGPGVATPGAFQSTNNGGEDAFISVIQSDGSALVASTYLGGSGADFATGVAVGPGGDIYVTGTTTSTDLAVSSGAVQSTLQGAQSAFVARLNSTLSAATFLTYLGGRKTSTANAIAVDRNTGNAVVVGTTISDDFPTLNALQPVKSGAGSVVLKSADSGLTWVGSDQGIASLDNPQRGPLFGLLLDNAGTLVVPYGSVFRSTDGASSWTNVLAAPQSDSYSFGAQSGGTIYAAPVSQGVLGLQRSTDGGASWSAVGGTPNFSQIGALVVHPTNPNILYVTDGQFGSYGVQMSSDGGVTWSALNQGLGAYFSIVTALAISPVNPSVLYCGTGLGIYKTVNGGALWSPTGFVSASGVVIDSIVPDPTNVNVAYAVSNSSNPIVYQTYKTVDGGQTWSLLPIPVQSQSLAVAPSNTSTLYAGYSASALGGVYQSADAGATWTLAGSFPAGFMIGSLTVDPANAANVFAVGSITPASNVFVTELNSAGSGFVYSTFLSSSTGTILPQAAYAVAIDGSGNAYIGGANVGTIPLTTGGLESQMNKAFDFTTGFLVEISPAITSCSVTANPNSLVFYPASTSQILSILAPSGCSWTVSSPANWLSFSPASGSGVAQVAVTAAANSTITRSATISVAGVSVPVAQSGPGCQYSPSPSTINASLAGGPYSFSLNAASACQWQIGSLPSWISATSMMSGTGPAQVNLSILPNLYQTSRSWTIGFGSYSVVVNQSGAATVSRAGVLRQGFLWLLDADGNERENHPGDLVYAFGGIPGDIPITGDWNGDGHTKIGIYRPGNGLFILDSNGNGILDAGDAVFNLHIGKSPGDVPVVGDWNGDGRSKVGYFRQGFLWILDTNGNHVFEQGIDQVYAYGGVAGDIPVVGDWTGTGISKIGVFRQGFLWVLDANGNGTFDGNGPDFVFPYGGIPGDVPVVGDWTGTGVTQVGIFRQGFLWALDANGDRQIDAGDFIFGYGGIPGDIPVVGKW
ncbi:MAG TPA: SBBP repeat-containing protein [Bryobacteraceae bacterium]|nr:SBBP repeat-containing protein [Bryobacteraceae bacterium]